VRSGLSIGETRGPLGVVPAKRSAERAPRYSLRLDHPSIREIVVVHSTRVFAELLRCDAEGNWPAEPEEIGPDGTLQLDSIGFACALRAAYAQTHLA
jgi:hypothetical protein